MAEETPTCDDQQQMPQPTAEHARLTEHAGTWNVKCTFYMGPESMETAGVEEVSMLGGFHTTSTFKTDMFGAPFEGRATLGYDPRKGAYHATWLDSMTPTLWSFEGDFEGDTLVMRGKGPCMMTGNEADFWTTEKHVSPDERVFEMFQRGPDGSEIKMFTHVYTRA